MHWADNYVSDRHVVGRRVREGVGMVRSDGVDILNGAAVAQSAFEARQSQLGRTRRLQLNIRRLQTASQTSSGGSNFRCSVYALCIVSPKRRTT